jgi:hypothetical protein
MVDQKLKDYFKFDEADLSANQNGQFTEKQTARILKGDKSNRIGDNIGAYILLLIALIGLVVAVPVIGAAVFKSADWGTAIAIGLSFGCIWPLVWGGLGVRSLFFTSSSKHKFSLAKAQGVVNLESRQTYDSNNRPDIIVYTLHIGGKNFKADKSLTDVIMQGKEYAIYYYILDDLSALLSTKNILSAELI